ncbi:MAG: hypothetical protein HGB04_08875 [Chlorobiaceae bacterium]|nr:hypothetical protein [Chlorobiaceae bacterium]
MLKEAAGIAGGALLLPPLGLSLVACGLPGLLVAGAGMMVVDAIMKERNASEDRNRAAVAPPETESLEERLSDPFSRRVRPGSNLKS